MATTIKIKNSATPSSTPASLEQGEMALNVTDGKLFYGSGSGNDVKEFTGTSIDTGSFATTGSNTFIGDQTVTGSLFTTGSNTLIGTTTLTGSLNTSGTVNFTGTVIISGANPGTPPSALQLYGDVQTYGYHRFDPVTTNIDPAISASYIYVSGSTDDLYFSQNGKGYSNVTRLRWLEGNINTGLLYGGIVSGAVGGTTFNVAAGEGIITTMNAFTASEGPNPTINKVSWSDFNNVTPTYLNTHEYTWLLINGDGNLIQQVNSPSETQFRTELQVGVLIHPNKTNISIFKSFTQPSYASTQQIFTFIRSFGGLKLSGHEISASGSSLSLNRDSGTAFAIGRNYAFDPNSPSIMEDIAYNAPTVFRYYKSGSEFVTTTGTTTINPEQYNTPDTATGLSTVGNNRWTIQRVYFFPKSPDSIGVYYGRQEYSTLTDAIANLPYETFEENDNTRNQSIFLGYIIVEKGTTNLSNTAQAKFIQSGIFRTSTNGGGSAPVVTNLGDLNDVTLTTESDYDILTYDADTEQWVNRDSLSISSLTASADISASGDVYGDTFIVNEITASGNISGSQTGSFAYLQLPGFDFDSNTPSTSLEVQGPITSSAISSSGQIYGQVGANEYSTSNVASTASYSGDIIKLLSTAVTVRAVYYLNKTQWSQADNTAESTSDKLLAISVGTNSNQGMLLRGLFNLGYNPGGFPGDPVYLDATGVITATLPTTSGEVVRILGYNVDTNIIYFNPSNDYIVLV
jgi:hypothetical protein